MLEKISVIDQIEVLESGHIQVRRADKIMEDGVEISRVYHRHVLSPGDATTGQNARVAAIAGAVWTPTVVTAYRATQAKATTVALAKPAA